MDESTVEFEHEIDTGERIDLNGEWVAWLEGQPVPACVEGVDDALRHGPGDTAMA
ncbi:hypothetical protein ACTG9Q_18090 [Actinokineospora sp. 24-640]